MELIEKAIQIAVSAHLGQKDKAGSPYILHVLRVMSKMDTNETRILALLHDVVEDSAITISVIESYGFSQEVIESLKILTKGEVEDYMKYILPGKLRLKIMLCFNIIIDSWSKKNKISYVSH